MSQEKINWRAVLLENNICLPACPVIFIRLMDILRDENAEMRNLVKVLSTDQALTLEIVRVSNSSFYGAAQQIKSINEAAMRLGFDAIWSIASAIKIKEMFDISKRNWTSLDTLNWEHGLRTAAAAQVLASRLNPRFTEFFFTAGLLHDIGKVVLLHVDPRRYPALCEGGAVFGPALIEREFEAYGINHAAIGEELLAHWSLPDMLGHLLKGHHALQPDNLPAQGLGPLLLALSDEMAHRLNPASNSKEQFEVELELPPALIEHPKLAPAVFPGLAEDYRLEYKKLKEIAFTRIDSRSHYVPARRQGVAS